MLRRISTCILTAFLAISVAGVVSAQTSSSDVSAKASELWGSIKAYSSDKHKEAVGHGRKLIKDMDSDIAKLEKKAGKAKGDAKKEYQQQVKELKATRDKASGKLAHWGKQSGAAWNDAKDGFADAYRDLHQAYDKAASNIK